jgi:hypothetical protein
MKLTNLVWVLALAGAVAACNSGPPIECNVRGETVDVDTGRCEPSGGTGGTGGGGTGGTGGAIEGFCTTTDNDTVYADLDYTNGDRESSTGTEAASAIASDCVFGSSTSTPPITQDLGCRDQANVILDCTPNCGTDEIDALANCVETCTQTTIESITGSQLTTDCSGCYGETVACGAANCAFLCINPNAQDCVDCRCEKGCTPNFESCSGIPSTDCD